MELRQVIVLKTEKGEKVEMRLLDVFPLDGVEYFIVEPRGSGDGAWILKKHNEKLISCESEEEYLRVKNAYLDHLESQMLEDL